MFWWNFVESCRIINGINLYVEDEGMDENKFIEVGIYKELFNQITGANLPIDKIYRSKGLSTHMIKRKHGKYLKYLNRLEEIIKNPDYIGSNPNEDANTSIELIKKLDDNVMIGIKLNIEENYIYVSTVHGIQESKIERRLHSGRIKEIPIDSIDKT